MSPENGALPKLSEEAEALLGNWDVVPRDWEASAAAIDAKLAGVAQGSTEPSLLEPPLPREAEEGEIVAEAAAAPVPAPAPAPAPGSTPPPPAAQGPQQSLADLARASVSRSNAREEAASLAKETLAVASMRRGPSAEVVERVQAAAARAAAQSSAAQDASLDDTAPRASGVMARFPAKRRPNMGALYGAFAVVLGLAAAFLIFVRSRPAAEAPVPSGAAPLAVETPASIPTTQSEPRAELPAAPEPPSVAAPVSKPVAAAKEEPKDRITAPRAGGAAAPLTPAAPASAPTGPAPEKIVLEEDTPAAPSPEPVAPAPSAKPEPPMRPADGAPTSIPQKPSIGAVQAAMGSVMGAARSCVTGQAEPSRAQVVFGSDGTVQSVSVSGPAAGTAAAGCIEAALKKARMQPFAVPTFSTSVTIRPP